MVGRLAALGNCFHYFIATNVALCIFAGLGWRLRWRLHVAVQTATVWELVLFATPAYCRSKARHIWIL